MNHTTSLDEVPLFFTAGDTNLFGVLHRPTGATKNVEGFVFCHPFGEEKLWTHRVFVSFARRLAAAGYTVLRFDQRGSGDSGGRFCDTTLDTACEDVRAAVDQLGKQPHLTEVSLLGLRLGATIASRVADESGEIHRLVMWAPIVDGSRYMQDLLRMNVMTQTATFKEVRYDRAELVAMLQQGLTVNVDGYEMGRGMYDGVAATNLLSPHAFSGPALIVQIEPQPKPAPDLQKLAAAYAAGVLTFAQEEPFWKEIARFYQDAPNLAAATEQWLESGNNDHHGQRP